MDAGVFYRSAAVGGASPLRLVAVLYEQAIRDLRRAIAAHERGQIEERTWHLNHALLVIGHLEATLDKEQGGKVAQNLERFYRQLRASLVDAQVRQSAQVIEQQISLLMSVHDAWDQLERQESQNAATAGLGTAEPRSTGWKA